LSGLLALLTVFAAVAAGSVSFPSRARIYPLFVGIVGVLLATGELWLQRRRRVAVGDADESEGEGLVTGLRGILPYLAWLAGFLLLAWGVGLVLASGVFTAAFLYREGSVRWLPAALACLGVWGFLLAIGSLFGLHWPTSLIDPFHFLGLL
jgi:hypothetical protein